MRTKQALLASARALAVIALLVRQSDPLFGEENSLFPLIVLTVSGPRRRFRLLSARGVDWRLAQSAAPRRPAGSRIARPASPSSAGAI